MVRSRRVSSSIFFGRFNLLLAHLLIFFTKCVSAPCLHIDTGLEHPYRIPKLINLASFPIVQRFKCVRANDREADVLPWAMEWGEFSRAIYQEGDRDANDNTDE